MQRYFIDNKYINTENKTAFIEGKDYHHIRDVMRMKIGDNIILQTNDSKEYLCEIIDLSKVVNLTIIKEKDNLNELNCHVTIAQGLVRREKTEEVVRRIVELGASRYVNVKLERCNVQLKSKDDYKTSRLETIVKEASEQSERGKLLELDGYMAFKEFLNYSKKYDFKFVAYENEGRTNSHNINEYLCNFPQKNILFLVGPEGGFSPNEIEMLEANGFICIGLGKRILRTETAPLMIMSIVSAYVDYKGEKNED